jgi:hypothetical protein
MGSPEKRAKKKKRDSKGNQKKREEFFCMSALEATLQKSVNVDREIFQIKCSEYLYNFVTSF